MVSMKSPLLKVKSLAGTKTTDHLIEKLRGLQGRMKPWVATVEPKEEPPAAQSSQSTLRIAGRLTSAGRRAGFFQRASKQPNKMESKRVSVA